MAIHQDHLDRIIQGFIARLEQEIPVQEVILFGSYAHGKARGHRRGKLGTSVRK